MDNITPEELQRAAERVRELSRRSSVNGRPHPLPPTPDFVNVNRRQHSPAPETPANTATEKAVASPSKRGSAVNSLFKMINFKNLEIDSDVSLILGILLLLSSDNADEILSMALLYIML